MAAKQDLDMWYFCLFWGSKGGPWGDAGLPEAVDGEKKLVDCPYQRTKNSKEYACSNISNLQTEVVSWVMVGAWLWVGVLTANLQARAFGLVLFEPTCKPVPLA